MLFPMTKVEKMENIRLIELSNTYWSSDAIWYYVIMTKNIKQMNKAELISYAAEVGREDLNDDMTKREIIAALEEDGLDDVQEAAPEPEKKDVVADDGNEKIVKMIPDISYYSFGRYVFTKERKFILMDAESAEAIVKANPNEFKIASTKEVEDYYR